MNLSLADLLAALDHALQRLAQVLARVQAQGPQGAALLQARLAADMLPLQAQAETATHLALRIGCPLAGRPVPDFGDFGPGLDGLQQRVARARAVLAGLPTDAAAPDRLPEQAGQAALSLPPAAFALQFGLPNLWFHLSMVYAIARAHGVPLGKADLDGFHVYAAATVAATPPRGSACPT